MENELNYLNECINDIEHEINLTEFGIPLGVSTSKELEALNSQKEILENILNYITINEIN